MRALGFVALSALVAATFVVLEPVPAAVAAGSPCGPSINPVACENQNPGTDPELWDIDGSGDPSIQGFATEISVNAGTRVDFKIDTNARSYSIQIFRTGWYQGLGARKVASVSPSAALPQSQPQCISDVTTELYDCGTWGVSASWNVPAAAVSGVYFALLHRNDTGGESHIMFIVRNDGSQSDVVFQTSDTTWQAYNTYGGSDFYQGAGHGRAYKISYNRPFATRGAFSGRDFYFSAEYATVRFLERNGYDVSYISGVDTDRNGAQLLNHKVYMSVGHDEYWSGAQRANVEAARDAGVNLQFLSGNEIYWRTRYETSADGSNTPYRTLVSYKETWANSKIDPTTQWTGTWRDPRFATAANGGTKPENSLSGTMFQVNDIRESIRVNATEGKYRLWRNTGLSNLSGTATASLGEDVLGYESDEDIDNGFRPAGMIRLSTTTAATTQYLKDYGIVTGDGTTTHHLTFYKAASGARVFSAGTVQWGWGLDPTHDGWGPAEDSRIQQAQINLLADMGAAPGTLMSGLVAATPSTDSTAPTTSITAPAQGATIANGTKVTVTGTAADVGGRVAGVEVSADGGATWHPAAGTTSWTYAYIQQGATTASLRARAIDDSGNFSASGATVSLTVTGPYSALGGTVPAVPSTTDTGAVELGLKITPTSDGFVSGVRFYKGAANTGTHVGSLWDGNRTRLGVVTFTGETATGWQTAEFSNPIPVIGGSTYTVSYTAPRGGYAAETMYWPYQAQQSSPVSVVSGVGEAAPGVFGDPGAFPSATWNESNYFVDVTYTKSDNSPLRITSQSPLAGASSIAVADPISATFNRAALASSISMVLTATGGANVPGTVSYSAATKTASFTPSAALDVSKTYSVSVSATDEAGVALATGTGTWSFTTAAPTLPDGTCPCTLFADSVRPAVAAVAEGGPVTLGVRFSSAVAGQVTGLRFFKGTANTGTHVGTLWTATGTSLATVTFSGESTVGWQTATLSQNVDITPGTVYVVSYTSPVGGYSLTAGQFSQGFSRGPLQVPANGGVFTYQNGAFPDGSSSSNYFADVVFKPAAVGPRVVTKVPATASLDVPRTSSVSATFDTPVASTQISVKAGSTSIDGEMSLAADGKSLAFVPSERLPVNATIRVSLTSVLGVNGAAGPDVAWSFQTVDAAGAVTVTMMSGDPTGTTVATDDAGPVILGMKFSTSTAGAVRAIRFYKDSGNAGTHIGWLWGSGPTPLAQVTFADESAIGWQRAVLSSPVQIIPGQQYTVSYLAPQGHYTYKSGDFASPRTSGPLTSASVDNGVYVYDTSARPTSTWNSTNYLVDVEFVSVTEYSENLFGEILPATPAVDDAGPVELGTVFSVSQPGEVTAIRFYKGPGNTGEHIGSIWTESGTKLGSVTFTDETDNGWQRASLDNPVEVLPGQTYVVSYFAPVGRYSVQDGYFLVPRQSDLITGSQTANGRFLYTSTSAFPTESWGSSAYFVDAEVTFDAAAPPPTPTLVSTTPAISATDVDPATVAVTATLAHATAGTLAVTSAGSPVAGTSSFDSSTGVVTFSPTAPFARGTTYSVTVTADGGAVPGGTWSFATIAGVTITARTPAASATNVGAAAEVSATLTSAATATIALTSGGAAVAGTSSFNSSTGVVTFSPTAPFARGTTYSVSVTADGGSVPGGTWSFSTVPVATITARTPAAAATNVDPATVVVSATLANAATATIALTSGGVAVAGTSSFNASTGVVSFTPSAALQRARTYAVAVTADGTAVTGGTWSFTTLPEAAIVSRTPASGATNVNPVSPGISATLTNASSASLAVTTGGSAVAGTSSFNATTGAVTFTPTASLQWGRTYSVTATANGKAVTSGTWSFSTLPVAVLTARTPASSATNVNPSTVQVTATLTGAVTAAITLTQAGVAVPGTSNFNATTRVVTFTPTTQLGWAKTYTATVTANGTSVSSGTWSFTTMVKQDQASLFTSGSPANANTTTAQDIQVATRFRASVPGVVTTIRFYKGSQNTGTHTGYLWSSTGTRLAQVTFRNETASGWQTATLSTPVRLTVGAEYRVSMYSTSNRYPVTNNALSGVVTSGVLSTVANGGAYTFSQGFPNNTTANKYWIDVIFDPDD